MRLLHTYQYNYKHLLHFHVCDLLYSEENSLSFYRDRHFKFLFFPQILILKPGQIKNKPLDKVKNQFASLLLDRYNTTNYFSGLFYTMPRGRDEEALITIVQTYNELWDPGHEKYKDVMRKENIWTVIAEKLDTTGKYITLNLLVYFYLPDQD